MGGLPKDDVLAASWFRKAADAGDATAMSNLGVMYANGMGGLPKDDAQAVIWYRNAADAGDAFAMNSLGAMYANGRGGLPKDNAQAASWYRKAADAGFAPPPPPPPPPSRVRPSIFGPLPAGAPNAQVGAPPPGGFDRPSAQGGIRVDGNVQQANLIHKVDPVCPPLAVSAKIAGIMRFTVIVAKTGGLRDIQVVSGHPLLIPAALAALKQWQYKPTLLNGEPVEVLTRVDINMPCGNP
jgi:hypothetical protein